MRQGLGCLFRENFGGDLIDLGSPTFMSLNKTSQEEIEKIEAEILAAFIANTYIQQFEKINLIGNQEYGKPKLPEEKF